MLRTKDIGTNHLISSLFETVVRLSDYATGCKTELEKLRKENEQLKEKSNLTPENSSKPSSSQAPHERKQKKSNNKKPKSKLKPGAQEGHKGCSRSLIPPDKVDKIIQCNPIPECSCGGKILPKKLRQRPQVHDFDDGKLCLFEYQIYEGKCDLCKTKYLGSLPDGISLRMLGPTAIAKISLLTTKYNLSKRKSQELLYDFHNLTVSTGTISNAEKLTGNALEKPVAEAHEHTKQSISLHADETGHFQKHKLAWMWVAVSMVTTIFIIMPSRSQKAAKQLLGKNYSGKLISDRYSAYNWIDLQNRQACWAHLIRDFTRISQRSGKAGQIGELLLSLYTTVDHDATS
jgi:transposase